MADNWDTHYSGFLRIFGTKLGLKGNLFLNGLVAEIILAKTKNMNCFLEIGAGSGNLSRILSAKFKEGTVLDKSFSALELSSKRAPQCTTIKSDIFLFKSNF